MDFSGKDCEDQFVYWKMKRMKCSVPLQVMLCFWLACWAGNQLCAVEVWEGVREWRSADGKVVSGELVSGTEEEVVLRVKEQTFTVPLARLSEGDRAVALAWWKAQQLPEPGSLPMALSGQELLPGKVTMFRLPVPEARAARAVKEAKGLDAAQSFDVDLKMEACLAAVYLPADFEPSRNWKVLIVQSTARSSANGTSCTKAVNGYREAADAQGWVVIATDKEDGVAVDPVYHRWEQLASLLDEMERVWPHSQKWPVAGAGFSGGAKYAQLMLCLVLERGRQPLGVFCSGCNQEMTSTRWAELKLGKDAKKFPRFFFSNGLNDKVASPAKGAKSASELNAAGFPQTRLETYEGGHQLFREHIPVALEWIGGKRAGE